MRSLAETAVMERLIPELEADGFQVFTEPDRLLVPSFLGDYRPDLIALRSDRNLAIEVADRTGTAHKQLDQVASLFKEHPDWEFRLIWINQEKPVRDIAPQSAETVRASLKEVERLMDDGHDKAALLLSWAVFEAMGRLVVQDRFRKPQTPARLIEIMATEGILAYDEAQFLRTFYPVRNEIIHGGLDREVTRDDLQRLTQIMKSVLAETRH